MSSEKAKSLTPPSPKVSSTVPNLMDALEEEFPGFRGQFEIDQRADALRTETIKNTQTLLRQMRKRRGWSQNELAKRLNVTQPVISRLESGDYDGNGPTLGNLSDVVNQCGFKLEIMATPIDLTAQHVSQEQESVQNSALVVGVLDALNICYLETNENDVIVASNQAWRSLHKDIEPCTHGEFYVNFLKAGRDHGLFPGAENDSDWVDRRLSWHHEPTGPFEIARQGNTLLEVTEFVKPKGGVITIGKDVTYRTRLREMAPINEAKI